MPRTHDRRQTGSVLQNRRVQLVHALLIVTYLVVYTVLLSGAALVPTILALRGDAENATLADAAQLFLFEERVWPLAVLLILACGLHSIFMSHRVFGPLVRVYREAAQIGQGDFTRRVRFRQNDHMLELRDALNGMVEELDQRMSTVHVARARCHHRLEQLRAAGSGGTAPSPELLAALEADFAGLEEALSGFQTSAGHQRLKAGQGVTAPAATLDPDAVARSHPETHQAGGAQGDDPGHVDDRAAEASSTKQDGDGWDGLADDQARSA